MESIKTLEKKLVKFKQNGEEKVEILNQLSKAYWSSLSEKALDYGKQALKLSEKIDDKEGKGKALNNIGVSYFYLTKYDSAIEVFFKALEIHEELGIKRKISSSYNNIGMIYDATGKYEKALEYYNNSLKIDEELEDKKSIANSLNNTGNTYNHLKKHDKSLEYHEKALKIFEKIDDKLGVSASLNNIGNVYLTVVEKPDKAHEYFLKSLKINKEIGNKNRIAISLINLGDCYTKLHNSPKALIYLEQGLKVSEEIEAKNLIRDCYKVYSELYSIKENLKKALEYYKLYSKTKDSIFTEESSKKIAEMQTKYETEKKEKEAEIFRLKNIELAKANKDIQKKNKELEIHEEHISLINNILQHDLTNNLSITNSAIRLFRKSNDMKMIDEILKSTEKSVELIRNMQNLEKFLNLHSALKLYYLNDVLDTITKNYDKISFKITGRSKVLADDSLSSVFENIIGNAVVHGKSDKIDITILKKEKICEVRIADNGVGIPEKIRESIFDEGFKYGKEAHTGMGLFIVKKAMENYGGTISVENNEPKGTIFVLTFRRMG